MIETVTMIGTETVLIVPLGPFIYFSSDILALITTTLWPQEHKQLHYNPRHQLQKVTISCKAPLTSGDGWMCKTLAVYLQRLSNVLSRWLSLRHLNTTLLTELKELLALVLRFNPLAGRQEKGQTNQTCSNIHLQKPLSKPEL